jgi:outer membrane protein OmpA-like peptidoglycan-associated protein
VKKAARVSCRAAGIAVLAAITAGCGLTGFGAAGRAQAGPPVTVTERFAPSVLVTVAGRAVTGPALLPLVAATARPLEDVVVIRPGTPLGTVISADAPEAAKVIVPGKPAAPGPGATSFQWAEYRDLLKIWHSKISSAQRAVRASTEAATSGWARGLPARARLTALPGAGEDPGTLGAECAAAASALAGLQQEAGNPFGARRVVLLDAASLGGALTVGELAGDDVIVVTSFLPTAAVASAVQANLLRAGATRASVLGPEAAAAQLAQLITEGLSQRLITETLSGSALFANGSAVLQPGAAQLLAKLLPLLRRPGAAAVINGYASTTGTGGGNYLLSYTRAAAVARFLEAHAIPASSLVVVGHGASNLIAPGPSAANRRVTIVIEELASSRS